MGNKILIVDDDISFVYALKWQLKQDNFKIKWSTSKEDALFLLKEYHPDIIILDLHLDSNVIDTSDAIDILKKAKEIDKIKVVISTVENSKKIREKLLNDGADDYLNKPYKYEELKKRIVS